ncbi:MAG: hypothetical protein KH423_07150 [Actinomycetaceae bacterium]|nr:hypothetical protein [Actinomycetaceae bacterium]
MTPINHVENLRQIFVNIRQSLTELAQELEATETDLLYWMESGVEADYMLTTEPDNDAQPELPEVEAEPTPEPVELVNLEEARGELAEISRAGFTDQIKVLIRAQGKVKLSELSLEQVNAVLIAAREAVNASQ